MSQLRSFVIFFALAAGSSFSFAADTTKELSWASVRLTGMHLRLLSPKAKNRSEDLFFGKGGNLSVDACSDGMCTGPLTVWKIENNRLKIGFAPTDGDTLVGLTHKQLSLRRPDGKVYVYAIIPKDGT